MKIISKAIGQLLGNRPIQVGDKQAVARGKAHTNNAEAGWYEQEIRAGHEHGRSAALRQLALEQGDNNIKVAAAAAEGLDALKAMQEDAADTTSKTYDFHQKKGVLSGISNALKLTIIAIVELPLAYYLATIITRDSSVSGLIELLSVSPKAARGILTAGIAIPFAIATATLGKLCGPYMWELSARRGPMHVRAALVIGALLLFGTALGRFAEMRSDLAAARSTEAAAISVDAETSSTAAPSPEPGQATIDVLAPVVNLLLIQAGIFIMVLLWESARAIPSVTHATRRLKVAQIRNKLAPWVAANHNQATLTLTSFDRLAASAAYEVVRHHGAAAGIIGNATPEQIFDKMISYARQPTLAIADANYSSIHWTETDGGLMAATYFREAEVSSIYFQAVNTTIVTGGANTVQPPRSMLVRLDAEHLLTQDDIDHAWNNGCALAKAVIARKQRATLGARLGHLLAWNTARKDRRSNGAVQNTTLTPTHADVGGVSSVAADSKASHSVLDAAANDSAWRMKVQPETAAVKAS